MEYYERFSGMRFVGSATVNCGPVFVYILFKYLPVDLPLIFFVDDSH